MIASMDRQPILIIIMGLPATGKTTLSLKIADQFDLPLISRDELKVRIMDSVGWGDREWSKKIGQASYSVLDYIIEQNTRSKSDFIIETDFNPQFANEKFNRIHLEGYHIVQIVCSATAEVILARWKARAAQDTNHPSNTEGEQGLTELKEAIARGQSKPLDVPSDVIQIDTSQNPDIEQEVLNKLQNLLT